MCNFLANDVHARRQGYSSRMLCLLEVEDSRSWLRNVYPRTVLSVDVCVIRGCGCYPGINGSPTGYRKYSCCDDAC